MAGTRNATLIKNELKRYISSLGLTLNTLTKARGNRGFFKEGRIDISKTLDDESAVRVIVHEFAHYVNHNLDKKLKSLEPLFGEDNEIIRDELISVTAFVDNNSMCIKLTSEREQLKSEIKDLIKKIKLVYPKFSVSETFREFNRYTMWSDLKYLEKYDRIRVQNLLSTKTYSIKNIRSDFPDTPEVFVDYINLKSKQRMRAKISRKISKINKYYNEPCELYARFIEGLYIDMERTKELAPQTYKIFEELYRKNHYKCLPELFSIIGLYI